MQFSLKFLNFLAIQKKIGAGQEPMRSRPVELHIKPAVENPVKSSSGLKEVNPSTIQPSNFKTENPTQKPSAVATENPTARLSSTQSNNPTDKPDGRSSPTKVQAADGQTTTPQPQTSFYLQCKYWSSDYYDFKSSFLVLLSASSRFLEYRF